MLTKVAETAVDAKALEFSPWPRYEVEEIEAAVRILNSGKVNYWTGQEGKLFENEFAAYVGCKHAVAVANGTVALELALRVLGVGPGDDVITSPRTFIASASCAVSLGARPVFAEVDRESQNITADTIRAVLTPKTKAIVAVHLAGWPCEMDDILQLARERNLKVIEDCAQAHGAEFAGRRVGSMGDIGAFSFCQDKIMSTAGEGGMITTNSEDLWERAWAYKDHGKNYRKTRTPALGPGFRWLHESFGTNWRLTEIQSAIGRVQLRKLNEWVVMRSMNASVLSRWFSTIEALRTTIPPAHIRHSYYKYYAFVRPERLRYGWDRDRIVAEISAARIPCFTGSCGEVYLEKAFPPEWNPQRRFAMAKELGETSIMFPVHPGMNRDQIRRMCDVTSEIVTAATEP
jgi:hypothetical protein